MDEFTTDKPVEYAPPTIEDYGTLRDLTASGGANYTDVPAGTPVNGGIGSVAGSTA